MTSRVLVVLNRLRQPAYIGENRCLPCTVINLGIALTLSIAVGTISIVGGVACFVVCALVIYFRGYLVPGTPHLTARYLPESVLRLFETHSGETTHPNGDDDSPGRLNTVDVEPTVNPTRILEETGVVKPCTDQDDLCLSDDFREDWMDRIGRVESDEGTYRRALADVVGVDDRSLSIIETGEGVIADVDETWVGTWPSRAALVADIAAEPLLDASVDEWDDLDDGTRGLVLTGLRSFVPACPACGGSLSTGVESRSISCCRSVETAILRCKDCGATVLNQELSRTSTGGEGHPA